MAGTAMSRAAPRPATKPFGGLCGERVTHSSRWPDTRTRPEGTGVQRETTGASARSAAAFTPSPSHFRDVGLTPGHGRNGHVPGGAEASNEAVWRPLWRTRHAFVT